MTTNITQGLASWEEIKKTIDNPPEDPKVQESWESMNDYVLNFILSLLM